MLFQPQPLNSSDKYKDFFANFTGDVGIPNFSIWINCYHGTLVHVHRHQCPFSMLSPRRRRHEFAFTTCCQKAAPLHHKASATITTRQTARQNIGRLRLICTTRRPVFTELDLAQIFSFAQSFSSFRQPPLLFYHQRHHIATQRRQDGSSPTLSTVGQLANW